jgi:hypothetical protein
VRQAAAVLVVAALGGCGGGGEKHGGGGATAPAATAPAATVPAAKSGTTFEAGDVPFTFAYPAGFKQIDEPHDGKVIATVTPTPDDVKNGLKIRKVADTALPFSSYRDQFKRQFEGDLGTTVKATTETHGGTEFGVLTFTKDLTYQDLGEEKTTELHSESYFFTGAGKAWQLECISAAEHRTEIDKACAEALGSLSF